MHIVYMELLAREARSDGSLCSKLCLHGTHGESVQMTCELRQDGLRSHRAENAALAQEALRQLRRMPEYRRTGVTVSPYAMPLPHARRVLRLAGQMI